MGDVVVTGAGFRVIKNLDGRKYTLAAPSYGEAGRLTEASALRMRPPPPVILEEAREALKRLGRPELVPEIDEYESANIHFEATIMAHGGADESREEIGAARERMLRAQVAQRKIEWLTRDDAALRDLRALDQRLAREEHLAVLEACLKGWEGEDLPPFPESGLSAEFISARLAAGDVAALGAVSVTLMSPTKEVVGN